MVMRRCPKCGTTGDDQFGFCIKCGYEFPQVNPEANNCPLCGYENPEEAVFCVKCGTPLIFNQNHQGQQPIVIKYTNNSTNPTQPQQPEDYKPTSKWIILFGYIFSILGGLLGLIIAIYLSTRKDPVARRHGHIQLGILVLYLILILIFFATGQLTMSDVTQMYSNMSSMKV